MSGTFFAHVPWLSVLWLLPLAGSVLIILLFSFIFYTVILNLGKGQTA